MLSRLHGINIGRTTASDGFFLNLSWVMLLLSAPFAKSSDGVNPRLMGVDPGYCSVKGGDNEEQYGGVLVDFSQEAKMASASAGINKHSIVDGGSSLYCGTDDEDGRLHCQPVLPMKFVTHCFFLTHRCLALGLTSSINTYKETVREHNDVREGRERESNQ